MHEIIKSVGIDIGTSTTQLIFSELTIENEASNYVVPRINIVDKKVTYRSKIYFTPLLDQKTIDAEKVKEIIEKEDADIIIFQKKILPGHKYQDIYKLKGKVFLCHIDDDFEGMNEEVYKKTLEISDLILVGNKAHAKNLSNYINTPVEVIVAISDFENYKFFSINQKNNKKVLAKMRTLCYTVFRQRECWNWQTGKTKDLVGVCSCGFKSHLPQ